MKAVLSEVCGGPDTLVYKEVDKPAPKKGEFLVRVHACALNFFDTLIIKDQYQFKPPRPFAPSAEFSGVVEMAGENTDEAMIGREVIGNLTTGAACDYVCVPAHACFAKPPELSHTTAAGLIVTYGTSLHAIKDRGRMRPGEKIAILGASGGVGQAAIEIAKALEGEVVACASSDEKLAICQQLGADVLLNYKNCDLKTELKRAGGAKGLDLVYDAVGGDMSEPALRALGWEGRFLVVGFAAGGIPKIPLNLALLKGCDIVGVFWGRATVENPAQHRDNMNQLMRWAAQGVINPLIDVVAPLRDTAVQIKRLADRLPKGKIILVPDALYTSK